MKYNEIIKNIRIDNDIKQYELAKELGILPKAYNMYENGYRNIPIDKLDNILIKFNISLDYILELSKEKTYKNLNSINLKLIPINIKKIRKEKEISQKEMAEIIGCSQQAMSEYETGKLIIPIDLLKIFCLKNNVSADYITGKTKINNKIKN